MANLGVLADGVGRILPLCNMTWIHESQANDVGKNGECRKHKHHRTAPRLMTTLETFPPTFKIYVFSALRSLRWEIPNMQRATCRTQLSLHPGEGSKKKKKHWGNELQSNFVELKTWFNSKI